MSAAPRRDPQVHALLESLDHPLKSTAWALRDCILEASPEIVEGYKWKSPSFRTKEFFATINLHDRNQVRLILHVGAKARGRNMKTALAGHPGVTWLGEDRAMVVFVEEAEVQRRRDALQGLLRDWIRSF
jgi:hypothetical protein